MGWVKLKRRVQPDGYRVEYHYDTEERLIGVTNQRGERYDLNRDALGRIVEEVDYWGAGSAVYLYRVRVSKRKHRSPEAAYPI